MSTTLHMYVVVGRVTWLHGSSAPHVSIRRVSVDKLKGEPPMQEVQKWMPHAPSPKNVEGLNICTTDAVSHASREDNHIQMSQLVLPKTINCTASLR